MTIDSPQCLWQVAAELGEGPIWHQSDRSLYFVDVKKHQIHRCDEHGDHQQSWTAPAQISFILPTKNGSFICGLQDGIYHFSSSTGQFSRCNDVERDMPANRLNDGFVDSRGLIWFGSMDDGETNPTGSLYSMDRDGVVVAHDHDYVITNGPAMSADGRTLFHTDTPNKTIYAFDVAADNTLSNKRVFVTLSVGHPDGMAVDADGVLWVAVFGGWRIDRFSASGNLLGSVPFPCANITKLTFGGTDLRTVFVTTARKGLTGAELVQQPLAGGLFSFRSDSTGLPQHLFSSEGLNINHSPCIVVMGVSGCGKSAVGKRLALETGAEFVEGDELHPVANIHKMAAGVALTDADRQDWLLALQAKIRTANSQGTRLVLSCSALKRKYRDVLRAANPALEFIHLHGERDLIAARLQSRNDHFMPVSLLESQFADLEALAADETGITLAIRATVDQLVASALAGRV